MKRWREGERTKTEHLSRMLGDVTCPQSSMIILSQCGQCTDMSSHIILYQSVAYQKDSNFVLSK